MLFLQWPPLHELSGLTSQSLQPLQELQPLQALQSVVQHFGAASSQHPPQIEEQPVANKAAALAAISKPSVLDVRFIIESLLKN